MHKKNFHEELRAVQFWSAETEQVLKEKGLALSDCALQNREEIVKLCEWIEANNISSYLEIGCWTGRLTAALHRIFHFRPLAACDLGVAKEFGFEIALPKEAVFFEGNSHSPIFENWRKALGHIDLTFIDTDKTYTAIQKDFANAIAHPHRFIAIQGIAGSPRTGADVKRFWDELSGNKIEILEPHPEIGSPTPTLGIGIWSSAS